MKKNTATAVMPAAAMTAAFMPQDLLADLLPRHSEGY
jgi:hypothetical protein